MAASNEAVLPSDSHFWIDPFVSDVARWLDREVLEERPGFREIHISDRIGRICNELDRRGAARMIRPNSVRVWVMSPATEQITGWPDIPFYSHFTQPGNVDASLETSFEKVVKEHAERRLPAIMKYTESLFQLCSNGELEVIGIDEFGSFT